ncbi:MAG: MxaK protein [Methylophagaceae bacterium]
MNKPLQISYWIVVFIVLCSALIAVHSGFTIWQQTKVNNYILSESSGEQQPPRHYKALFSYAYNHASNEQPQQALDSLTQLVAKAEIKEDSSVRASSYFNRGNIHLRQAQAIEVGELKRIPLIELAKQDYRTALLLQSNLWDARYNLEVALRMVPELPDDDGVYEQPTISSEKSVESVGFRVDLP